MKNDMPLESRVQRRESSALGSPLSSLDSKIVRSQKSLLLDKAYQAYFDRLEHGEKIDPDEYCAQHPHMRSSLGKLLQLHSFLQENDLLAETFAYPAAGETFLHFTLLHELGAGAFAKVYLAEDTVLGRRAALKLSRRAKAEAKIMGPIEHNNIVLVHYIAEDQESGLTAICMPYRGSATLENVLQEIQARRAMPASAGIILQVAQDLPMPVDAGTGAATSDPIWQRGTYVDGIRSIGAQIADALAYLHARDICHRDMKPSNILMTPNGTPLLLDFNLSSDFHTESMPFGGTLTYMAPEILSAVASKEQAATTAATGAKADIYSFGVILYQLLTGKHPLGVFSLKLKTLELRDLLLVRQKQGVTPARAVNPQVDRALSELVQRCLAPNPNDRPATALAIAAALTPTPTPPSAPTPKPASRHRTLAFAGVLLLVLLIGVAALVSVLRAPTIDEQLQAGRDSYRQGDYRTTIKQCERLLLADPDSANAIFLSARAKQKLAPTGGKTFFDSALTDYLALDKKSPHGRNKAGVGYCRNGAGLHEEAITAYQRALNSGYENAEVYNNLGFCFMKTGRLKEAVQSLDRAIKMKPKLAMPYYNRATVAMNLALRNRNMGAPKAKLDDDEDRVPPLGEQPNLTTFDGINDIQAAIKLGETSATVYYDAALLCAIAAETDRRRVDEAMEYLKLSLHRGQNPAGINHIGFKFIRKEIDAAQLAKFAIAPVNSTPTFPFLDPIID